MPLLFDLLEQRYRHVRLVLLEHMGSFVYLCSEEDIKEFVLPEVSIVCSVCMNHILVYIGGEILANLLK